jgi:hypothetical protein
MTVTAIPGGTTNWDSPLNAALLDLQAQATALQNNAPWGPTDQGLLAWTMDPVTVNVNEALTGGIIYFEKMAIRNATTVTNAIITVGTAGVGLTSGQNFVAVYNNSGVRQGLSADLTTTVNSTGTKTIPLAASFSAAAGLYYVAILFNAATTTPSIRGGSLQSGSMINVGTSPGRFIQSAGSQTSMPSSVTLGSLSSSSFGLFAALT